MVVWMEVTRDKYELPIYIADSSSELARITGAKRTVIDSIASKYKHGVIKRARYHRVEIPEEEATWM